MTKSLAAAAFAALVLGAVPAGAEAASFEGTTSQGKTATVATDGQFLEKATIFWVASCEDGQTHEASTVFFSSFADSTEDGSVIVGTYTDTDGSRVTIEFRGVPAGKGWRGAFQAEILRPDGVDCTVPASTFTAGEPKDGPSKVFLGTTAQKLIVTLNTRADGVVARVRMAWKARCDNGKTYERSTVFRNDVKHRNGVRNSGSYWDLRGTGKQKGERYRVTIGITGKRAGSGASERWSGTVSGRVVQSKKGKVFARCTIKKMRWSAARF